MRAYLSKFVLICNRATVQYLTVGLGKIPVENLHIMEEKVNGATAREAYLWINTFTLPKRDCLGEDHGASRQAN